MTATPAGVVRDMTRHLGEGGMPLLGQLGTTFTGAEGGQSAGMWRPTGLACNPRGAVQGGVFGVVLDGGTMVFAVATITTPDDETVAFANGTFVRRRRPAGAA